MSLLSYLFYTLGGSLFTALFLAVIFWYPDKIPWGVWIVLACGYVVALKVLWLKIQVRWFGPRLIIDITKYHAPPVCPVYGTSATVARFIEYHASGAAGPIHLHQTSRFPVLLSEEAAAAFDLEKVIQENSRPDAASRRLR